MLKSIKNAFKVKDLRKKLLFNFYMLLLIRLGSQIPIPGVDLKYFKEWFAQNSDGAFNLLSAFTGGSFERFSLFSLGITPYITASIVIQLLTIVFPYLEELRKDGDYGKKKLDWINRWTAIGLALMESIAMTIGFSKSRIIPNLTVLKGLLVVVCLTLGSAALIGIGELIEKKGIGNGISIVLLINILAGIPQDYAALFETFVLNKTLAKGFLCAIIIVLVSVLTITMVIYLGEAVRKVPIQYSKKTSGSFGAQRSFIPIKVNVSSVIPVIFASSLYSIPQMLASMLGKGYGSGFSKFFLNSLNQNNWFNPQHPEYTSGLILYIVLILFFGFFYTAIAFNPMEVADNLRKQGAVIPGLRAGKPTEEYLSKIINRLVVIGNIGLIIIVLFPIFLSGVFGAKVTFGGTSLIIIAGVILETMKKIEMGMRAQHYEGFLVE